MDFNQVLTEDPRHPFLPLSDFLKGAEEAEVLGNDYEGTGLHIYDGRDFIYGTSLAYYHPHLGRVAHYLPFKHNFGVNLEHRSLEAFRDTMVARAASGKPTTTHNGQYDLQAFRSLAGVDYEGELWDTLVWSQLINENQPFSKSLDTCAKMYLDIQKIEKPPANTWKYQAAENIYTYARQDAILHLELALKMKPLMEAEKLFDRVWPQKQKTLRILLEMKRRGVLVNTELCEREYSIGVHIMDEITEALGINPGSPLGLKKLLIDELGLPVVKVTPNGAPSFDKEAMEIYDEMLELVDDPTAAYVREYRGYQKATSSCYRAYLDKLSPDGRLRTSYNQHRTKTGRLSSSDPNLQQIPRQSNKDWSRNVKRSFVGKPGYVLLEGDYSQLEFRLGAAYAGEMRLLEIFNDDSRDVFTEMTKQLEGEFTEEGRYRTKTKTYTIQYGGGVKRLEHVFRIPYAKALEQKQNFEATYANMKKTSDHVAAVAKRKKKVPLWSGRYRHFAFPKTEAHKAFNSVMQGGAADIVEFAMHRAFDQIDNEDCRLLMQVHDSLVFEVREDLVDVYKPQIKEIMEDVRGPASEANPTGDFGVKFKVDVHSWAK